MGGIGKGEETKELLHETMKGLGEVDGRCVECDPGVRDRVDVRA